MIRSIRHKGLRRYYETGSTLWHSVRSRVRLRMQLGCSGYCPDDPRYGHPWVQAASPEGKAEGTLVHLGKRQLAVNLRVQGRRRLLARLRGLSLMAMHNPPHPGEFIREVYLLPYGLSVRALAEKPRCFAIHHHARHQRRKCGESGNGASSGQGARPVAGELACHAAQLRSVAGAQGHGSLACQAYRVCRLTNRSSRRSVSPVCSSPAEAELHR